MAAIEAAGYRAGDDVAICLDPAASEFFRDARYELAGEGRSLSSGEMVDYWVSVCDRYPVLSLEDGMAEQDWDGWMSLTERLGDRVQLVGDDVFVRRTCGRGSTAASPTRSSSSSPDRDAHRDARHDQPRAWRGLPGRHLAPFGRDEDTFIADLAVATGVGQIKSGAPARSERVAKYNQLIRIEEELGTAARYAGRAAVALS